jgi:hypothetical protein
MFGSILKEPQILPKTFDDTCSKFCGFINQICLIIQLHQHCYLNDRTQVGLIGTLLLGTTITWFTPFLKCQFPLLKNFEAFFKEFVIFSRDSNKKCTTRNKLQAFHQGTHLASMYVFEFKQLACDISWDKVVLMSQF